ncbi:MAG TPA: Sir2 family NAD-dependent protein deacetylase, partial [Anaerolineales bacterium]|nr:Sir2 family NAD-dependent protein deacetylase [Anaerolineales bacterium]
MNQTASPALASVAAIEDAAELLRKAKRIVVLTGAGFSSPSGIPDFRSDGSGLWSRDEPMEVASLTTFRTSPERFFNWFRPLAGQIFHAKPNPAHKALGVLENSGRELIVVTQNIDGLHQKAGSIRVVEMHGTLRTLSCTECFKQFESGPFLEPYINDGILPKCLSCNGILKPDVILFGEQL